MGTDGCSLRSINNSVYFLDFVYNVLPVMLTSRMGFTDHDEINMGTMVIQISLLFVCGKPLI